METRGDERVELLRADTNNDGKTDVWVVDTDGDGKADLFQFDTDGDGKVDITMVDIDEDGQPDEVVDGDGGLPPSSSPRPSRSEPYEAPGLRTTEPGAVVSRRGAGWPGSRGRRGRPRRSAASRCRAPDSANSSGEQTR